jgi:virulence-associated protein VagC
MIPVIDDKADNLTSVVKVQQIASSILFAAIRRSIMPKTAQIFSDNGHQAIRLPEDIHLTGTEVLVRLDEQSGDIILSSHDKQPEPKHPNGWDAFFQLRDQLTEEERAAFVIPRDRTPLKPRDIF